MSVIRMSYLDLSPEQRKKGAKAVKDRIQASLSNPDLAPEQIQQLHNQLKKIDLWERGAAERPSFGKLPPVSEAVNPALIEKVKELTKATIEGS